MSDSQLQPISDTVKSTLQPYIKSREQVAYIRRVLALHLQKQQHRTDDLRIPLSLLDASDTAPDVRTSRAADTHTDYLRAVRDNVRARREYADLFHRSLQSPVDHDLQDDLDPIQEHIAIIKLKQKQEKLATTQRYLDHLAEQPASSPEVMNLHEVLKSGPRLPTIPQEVVNSIGVDSGSSTANLSESLERLEKVVLRARLQLRREEQWLEAVRSRVEPAVQNPSPQSRLHALNTTRNELINWIETELSKASEETDGLNSDKNGATSSWSNAAGDESDVSAHLIQIKDKYSRYVLSRKSLLEAASNQPAPLHQSGPAAPATTRAALSSDEEEDTPNTYLIIPYLEKLQELSRLQKGMIQHKGHLNSTLTSQVTESCQMMDHLVEESQLLLTHPVPGSSRAESDFGEAMACASSDKPQATRRVQPWVFAADSSKIASLEAIAEKVEVGQMALESSMRIVRETDQLLGRGHSHGAEGEDATEDDIWLAGEIGSRERPKERAERKKSKQADPNDPWSVLHGNLGLIG